MSSDLLPDLRPGLQSLDGTGETEIRRIIADYEARAAADETTWGMSLSSASKRAAVKRHTMRFDVYNSFGLSVEQLEDVVGSQDERRKGSGADLGGTEAPVVGVEVPAKKTAEELVIGAGGR
eukprot:SAG11_NODE_306_length_10992_cov_46.270816_7_plen_122_part_00